MKASQLLQVFSVQNLNAYSICFATAWSFLDSLSNGAQNFTSKILFFGERTIFRSFQAPVLKGIAPAFSILLQNLVVIGRIILVLEVKFTNAGVIPLFCVAKYQSFLEHRNFRQASNTEKHKNLIA